MQGLDRQLGVVQSYGILFNLDATDAYSNGQASQTGSQKRDLAQSRGF
jgi:hypothetical protein